MKTLMFLGALLAGKTFGQVPESSPAPAPASAAQRVPPAAGHGTVTTVSPEGKAIKKAKPPAPAAELPPAPVQKAAP
jgi:hypothetical protein